MPHREVASQDDLSWAERCGHWLNIPVQKRGPGRLPRQRHEPLVITGHGMGLRIDNGALVVRDGFTHYPQALKELRFFPGASNLPSRIVACGRQWKPVVRRDGLACRTAHPAHTDRLAGQCRHGAEPCLWPKSEARESAA